MKRILFLLFILVIGLVGYSINFIDKYIIKSQVTNSDMSSLTDVSAESSPNRTLINYFNLSRENQFYQLKEWTILTPQTYNDFLLKFEKHKSELENKKKLITNNANSVISNGKSIGNDLNYEEVTKNYPKLIRDLDLKIEKIISVKIKGSDCSIKVKLFSDKNKPFEFEETFLMHLEEGKWKIFTIDSGLVGNFPE